MKKICLIVTLWFTLLTIVAQPRFSLPHGFYSEGSLTVAIEAQDATTEIRYTTDGSEPTTTSELYTAPLELSQTTILRAVEVRDGNIASLTATASYIFAHSVLSQSNTPEGYPTQWGAFTQFEGMAPADYGMDPEMTGDGTLRQKIAEGLTQLPILSIVSDKDNFFSHENDPDRGGIYIFTGPPVGDATGHGWTRPTSIELMGGPQQHDLTTTCGIRLHGGHGRLAEKNPKHSFRLVFKEQYGPKTLKYPVFGADEPQKFDQLVLRCHFGNAWQHWDGNNRNQAQYTRDVWARRMQRNISGIGANALYVHLFLNGMYWGVYNIAERIDDQYGKNYLGGQKTDIDVVKLEEDGGYHIEAAEGTLDAWKLMTETVGRAASDAAAYEQLDTLLDIDQFIDYMLINQYDGNTDWDHHNWYAVRRRGTDSEGFKFLCWDSEIIFENVNENNLSKNNGSEFPTGIFHSLLSNENFARRYQRRAKELLTNDGLLGQQSVVELWDSLYHTIDKALYAEAARWGDYRRDVHPWQSRGQLYTVDNQFMNERNRLLNQYFPYRTEKVLNNILAMVNIDDFEAPADWVALTASMFYNWNGVDEFSQPTDVPAYAEWNMGQSVAGGTTIAGFSNVSEYQYVDLGHYKTMVIRGSGNSLRILSNRQNNSGRTWKELQVVLNNSDPYWDENYHALVIPLDDLKNRTNNEGKEHSENYLHLNAIKANWGSTVNVMAIYLIPKEEYTGVNSIAASRPQNDRIYNLNGQQVTQPVRGQIYIKNGKKYIF